MTTITKSRQTISAKQRNSNYRPNGQIASHVSQETREIKSTSPVIHSQDGYYIASKKFEGRYYLVTVENGVWTCSASDERVAANCIKIAQEYASQHAPIVVEQKQAVQEVEVPVQEVEAITEDQAMIAFIQMGIRQTGETVFMVPSQTESQDHVVIVDTEGNPTYCSCKWFKFGGWKQHLCKHAEAVKSYLAEEQDCQQLSHVA